MNPHSHVHIGKTITDLQVQLAWRDKEIADLKQQVLEQQSQITHCTKTIVEQQAIIDNLRYWLEQMQRYAEQDHKGLREVDEILYRKPALSALESALKAERLAERIKTLEETAEWFAHGFLNNEPTKERLYVSTIYKELRRLAAELKEGK